MIIYIKVKVKFINLEGGFWGLVDKSGQQYYPVNLPEQLKFEGYEISCGIRHVDSFNSNMWGENVEIISFTTINLIG